MTFATPLGLLALVSIPLIVAIHIFRRRFAPRTIAGLFLWQAGRQTPTGGGRIERLPITPSLLLECLAALALSLVLAGARLSSASEHVHLVVLLDDSASMGARNAQGERARDRAVGRVTAEIERLGSRARVTIVLSGERPTVLAGPAALTPDAVGTLAGWEPRAPHHSLTLGLRLARELAGQSGRLMIVSDAGAEVTGESIPSDAVFLAVGQPLPNIGIVAAERTLAVEQGRGLILLTLGNYSDTVQKRQLTVTAGDKPVLTTDISAQPGVSAVRLPIPSGLPALRVTLSADALDRDNEVVLVEPHPRVIGVENRLDAGRGRDAMTRALASLPRVTPAEAGHLQFVEAGALDSPRVAGVWRVAFGRAPSRVTTGEAQDLIGPFLLEKRHPLLAGVTLGGVVWTGAWPLVPSTGRPLVSSGERTLLADVSRTGEPTTLLFNLDLATTNLIRTPDWPILLSNVVELCRQNLPGPERSNYHFGEWIRVRLNQAPRGALRVRAGSWERSLPSASTIEIVAPSAGGLVEFLEGDQRLFEVGVNFLDESESDLRRRESAERGRMADRADFNSDSDVSSDPLFWILLAIASAALLANWCVPGVERRLA